MTQTDRIYLATEGGAIQCLREVEQTDPIAHNKNRKAAAGRRSAEDAVEIELHQRRAGDAPKAAQPSAQKAGGQERRYR